MSVREDALKWWRALEPSEQVAMANAYYPSKHPLEITTSSQKIETIYRIKLPLNAHVSQDDRNESC